MALTFSHMSPLSPETSAQRRRIIEAVRVALEPQSWAHALWEGGAASFDRVDDWSDIDVQVVVDDANVDDAFVVVEQALAAIAPIDLIFVFPQPSWHGHAQKFYRLEGVSPYLIIDFAVMKRSAKNLFLEPEIHGTANVLFDKAEVVRVAPYDTQAHLRHLRHERMPVLRAMFDIFAPFVQKELNRGNFIEAMAFYHSMVLRPLIELLRIRYAPVHSSFYSRYIYYDLPPEVVKRVEPLFFVGHPDEFAGKQALARMLFDETYQVLGVMGDA